MILSMTKSRNQLCEDIFETSQNVKEPFSNLTGSCPKIIRATPS
jgi:hypothetical protein